MLQLTSPSCLAQNDSGLCGDGRRAGFVSRSSLATRVEAVYNNGLRDMLIAGLQLETRALLVSFLPAVAPVAQLDRAAVS